MQLLNDRRRRAARIFVGAALLACTASCSLMSFKSLDRPLSTRDMNSRVLTREYAVGFRAAVEQCADEIMKAAPEPAVVDNALNWKISATSESQRAALRLEPLLALLDTWAFATQMSNFVSADGAGRALFGTRQSTVRAVADGLAADATKMAARLLPAREFERYDAFVTTYVSAHPLADLHFVRASVVEAWSRESGSEVKLVESLGTIPEVSADLAQRMQIYGDTTPTQVMWQTQLALRKSGYGGSDLRSALAVLDQRLEALSDAADSAPELMHGAVQDVRVSSLQVIDRFNGSMAAMIEAFSVERLALTESIRVEREAVSNVLDAQRRAVALDASRLADQVVKSYGEQVRLLAREAFLWLIVFSIIVVTLPFVAGYLVGRSRH